MTAQELRDAIAARAAGEDFPGLPGLDAELERSQAARADRAELEAVCALMRAATPAPSEERRTRAIRSSHRHAAVPRWAWVSAAAGILVVVSLWSSMILKRVRPLPPADPRPGEHLASPEDPLQDVLSDLSPATAGTPRLGERDVQVSRGTPMGGGDGGGAPEFVWLGPVAAQAGELRAFRPSKFAADARLVRAKVLRTSKGGPPTDALWLRYAGKRAEFVLVQIPAGAKHWLGQLALPEGWLRVVEERDGTAILAASPDCDEPALRKLLKSLEPLRK